MQFSLVSTIFNEAKRLRQTIADLEAQTIKPAEIIITDAGSSDASWEILTEWQQQSAVPIVLLKEEGCNVARGRDLAIKAAKYYLIVSTDFGCRFDPQWLEDITNPFFNSETKVVGGSYAVDENEINSSVAKAVYILSNGYKMVFKNTVPSSRSIAYYITVWLQVGGYPEQLTLAGDDTYFGKKILKEGFNIIWQKSPKVYWMRPDSLLAYRKESYRYGRGAGESKDPQNRRNVFVNGAELTLKVLFILSIGSLIIHQPFRTHPVFLFVTIVSLGGLRGVFSTISKWWRLRNKKYHLGILLLAVIIYDVLRIEYIKGFINGFSKKK